MKKRPFKVTDIVPDIEAGVPILEIGRRLKKSPATMFRYLKALRKAGYVFAVKRGRPPLHIENKE